jgi:alpha-beta hydrolase superfamily lysophospholipase
VSKAKSKTTSARKPTTRAKTDAAVSTKKSANGAKAAEATAKAAPVKAPPPKAAPAKAATTGKRKTAARAATAATTRTATTAASAPNKTAPKNKTASSKAATVKAAPVKTGSSKAVSAKSSPAKRAASGATPARRTPTKRATSSRRKDAPPSGPPSAAATAVAEPVAAPDSAATGGDLKFQVSDGVRLHYQVWRPTGAPKRLVILVHGFADHSGRFSYLVPHLVERGAVVYAYDQRGQGRSPGRTGHVMKFQRLVDDLDAFVKLARETEAGIPSFVYAHSTGAIAAMDYLYDQPQAVDGAVLSAPCLILTFEPPGWKTTLGRTISTVVPGFTMQAGFDPGTVSRDEEVVSANKKDPHVSQKMTARFYSEVYLKAMPSVLERIEQLRTPYLVVQGTEDRLVSPKVADEFEQRAAAHGIVKRYEGGYHESHNDIHREQVFSDVDEWLEAGGPRP